MVNCSDIQKILLSAIIKGLQVASQFSLQNIREALWSKAGFEGINAFLCYVS